MVPLANNGHKICSPVEAGDNGWLKKFMDACKNRAGCPMPTCVRAHVYQKSVDAMAGYLVGPPHQRPVNSKLTTPFASDQGSQHPQPSDLGNRQYRVMVDR
jgi:hypothetical protein